MTEEDKIKGNLTFKALRKLFEVADWKDDKRYEITMEQSGKQLWIPMGHFDTLSHMKPGSRREKGRWHSTKVELLWPEMKGKTPDNRELFKNVPYPKRTISINIPNAHQEDSDRYKRLLNIYLDGKLKEGVYSGDLSKVKPKLVLPDWSKISDKEEAEFDSKDEGILDSYRDQGMRHGLRWVGDRFLIMKWGGEDYFLYDFNGSKKRKDDLYYSEDKSGVVERMIECPSDYYRDVSWDEIPQIREAAAKPDATDEEKQLNADYPNANVNYCRHKFLYFALEADIEIWYHRSHFPEWRAIEEETIKMLDFYTARPDDASIVRLRKRKENKP